MKTHKKRQADHRCISGRSLTNRSRVTNKMGLIPLVDGRSSVARRWHDLIYLHTSDLGGEDNLSQAELSIVRRAATLTVELEHLEQKFALSGDGATESQLKTYQMTVNTLRRTLEALGLKRRARDVTDLSLGDVLRQGQHA